MTEENNLKIRSKVFEYKNDFTEMSCKIYYKNKMSVSRVKIQLNGEKMSAESMEEIETIIQVLEKAKLLVKDKIQESNIPF